MNVHQRGTGLESLRVDSICSKTVIGTAGLSRLRETKPVIATAMATGLMGVALLVREQVAARHDREADDNDARACCWHRRRQEQCLA